MNNNSEVAFDPTVGVVVLVLLVQLALLAYRWRNKTRLLQFVLLGAAALSLWGVVLFAPITSHAIAVDTPIPGDASNIGGIVPLLLIAVGGPLLFIGINYLILLGARSFVNQIWK